MLEKLTSEVFMENFSPSQKIKERNKIMKTLISKHRKLFLFALIVVVSVGFFFTFKPHQSGQTVTWDSTYGKRSDSSYSKMTVQSLMMNQSTFFQSSVGFSVGGAKDIDNFRFNIENGFMPLEESITYEGLFYDYYFNTGNQETCEELFCPSYSSAVSKNPMTGKDEYFLQVGLNSNIKKADFKRKRLNLVVVLDISGSMDAPFDSYYYDKHRKTGKKSRTEESGTRTKFGIAKRTVAALLKHLKAGDRFGFVTFHSYADVIIPLTPVSKLNMRDVESEILGVPLGGGTYLEAGYKEGVGQFSLFEGREGDDYENRIIFITDAMPNIGSTGADDLLGLTNKSAGKKIYTSFIGIGIDFNAELIEQISKIRGANYYSVHSAEEFSKRLDNEFEYMVTPLVFKLNMKLESAGFKIEKIYGSPEANESTGELMKVNTLFPSDRKDEETRGGVIIVKLKKTSDERNIKLSVSYEDRNGKISRNTADFNFPVKSESYYQNAGIRKAILLSRYAELLKSWLKSGQTKSAGESELNYWERQSAKLSVPENYKTQFVEFTDYFMNEKKIIGDETLNKELKILNVLTR